MTHVRCLAMFAAVVALNAGCTGPNPAVDSGNDAMSDGGGRDVRPDGLTDVADVTPDTRGPDVLDVQPDVAMDVAHDAQPDAPSDVPFDVTTVDAAVDGTPDVASDAGTDTVAQIIAVRAAADGTVSPALPIHTAVVTYVLPAFGTDPAGFFVQASMPGPALFVAVDATTLSPAPTAGDVVSFSVTGMATAGTLREANAITGYMRHATGTDLTALVQDLSAATDLITGLGNYESEVLRLQGTIATAFGPAGTGHQSAQITTTGMTTADANLRLRVTDAVRAGFDLAQGCRFTLNATPMWRLNAQAQPSAWVTTDLTVNSCPAPRVVSAAALSATSVQVTFDRAVDPATVLAAGSAFTISVGASGTLGVTAAVSSGRQVTLTTATQASGASYVVHVDATVHDTRGVAIDPSARTATFTGFISVASLVLNELNPNITGSHDLIELRAVTGGSIENLRIEQAVGTPILLATFPLVLVAAGDLIVVHLGTPGASDATMSETTSTTQFPVATVPSNYDTAWDLVGGTTGLTFGYRVVRLLTAAGVVLDAVPFYTGTTASAFPGDLQAIQAAGDWLPASCGGAPCDFTTTPAAQSLSVMYTGCGTAASGNSVRRVMGPDTNTSADWSVGASSFGLVNP